MTQTPEELKTTGTEISDDLTRGEVSFQEGEVTPVNSEVIPSNVEEDITFTPVNNEEGSTVAAETIPHGNQLIPVPEQRHTASGSYTLPVDYSNEKMSPLVMLFAYATEIIEKHSTREESNTSFRDSVLKRAEERKAA